MGFRVLIMLEFDWGFFESKGNFPPKLEQVRMKKKLLCEVDFSV